MPEARDRLSRAVDFATVFAQRRSDILRVYDDQEADLFGSPRAVLNRRNSVTRLSPGTGRVAGRGVLGTPRTPSTGRGLENSAFRRGNGRGGGRVSNSVLPSWYPRRPLRDITAIVRAIERRRERLGGSRVQETESPAPHAHGVPDSSEPSPVAHLEHSKIFMSPFPNVEFKRCPPPVGKVQKILFDITNQPSDDSDFLTPQKKLLNSIDTVEKEVMEELRKLKRTASAKRAEREKKVRTLMSLR
ncbi:protein POLYCHOME [Mercurialis annua]|uniref:protein POLYCHOME n=1 Tax=Mercurialis annua TaxID=3986 RepID=UPI0021601561|nr:protein POLYCHOME [Mercurialis annua]